MLISDILRNNVKEKLARDEVVASMTVRLVRTIEIARIARTAGFDTLYVDLEHSSFSLETAARSAWPRSKPGSRRSCAFPPTRRTTSPACSMAARSAIIAPHVRSAARGPGGRAAAKFPPLGERSNAGGLPHLHFRSFPAPEAMPRSTMPPW